MDVEGLYERYGPMVLRRCRQLLGDEDDALDVTQDVFVRLLQQGDRLDVEHPSSFLYTVATRLCLNRLRDGARRAETHDEELLTRIAALDDSEARLGALSTLGRVFQKSPASSRTIATLHFLDGFTLEETARETGMSVSGVRKRLRSLRELLRIVEAS